MEACSALAFAAVAASIPRGGGEGGFDAIVAIFARSIKYWRIAGAGLNLGFHPFQWSLSSKWCLTLPVPAATNNSTATNAKKSELLLWFSLVLPSSILKLPLSNKSASSLGGLRFEHQCLNLMPLQAKVISDPMQCGTTLFATVSVSCAGAGLEVVHVRHSLSPVLCRGV